MVAIRGDLLHGAEDQGVRGDGPATPGRVLGVCAEDQAAGSTVWRRTVDGARLQQQETRSRARWDRGRVVCSLCRMKMLPVVILASYQSSMRSDVSERPNSSARLISQCPKTSVRLVFERSNSFSVYSALEATLWPGLVIITNHRVSDRLTVHRYYRLGPPLITVDNPGYALNSTAVLQLANGTPRATVEDP